MFFYFGGANIQQKTEKTKKSFCAFAKYGRKVFGVAPKDEFLSHKPHVVINFKRLITIFCRVHIFQKKNVILHLQNTTNREHNQAKTKKDC